MLILTNPVRLYGKKVIVDLLGRKGAPTPDTTPFYGMEKIFTKWSGLKDTSELAAPLEYIFALEDDYNADKSQPRQHSLDEYDVMKYEEEERGEYVKAYMSTENDPAEFKEYYRRLEDINQAYLENYVGNLVYKCAYLSSGSNSLSGLAKAHVMQPTLVDVNEDEETEYADTVSENNIDRATDAEIEYANEHIGYTLKRLHNLSRQLGIHVISYIGAYARAKEENERKHQSGSVKTLTSNDVVGKGVYLCDCFGNATKRLEVKNKNKHAAETFAWITGADNTYSAYLKDYYAFLHYCEILSVDIVNDTTLNTIGNDIISQLVIKTVTPNQQYNEQIFRALKENNPTMEVKSNSTEDIIESTVSLVNEACVNNSAENVFYNIVNQLVNYTPEEAKEYGVKLFNTIMLMQYPTFVIDISKVSWREGYLHYNDNVVMLDTNYISPKSCFVENRFLISELGVIVKLADAGKLVYMFTSMALSNVQKRQSHTDDAIYCDWSVR